MQRSGLQPRQSVANLAAVAIVGQIVLIASALLLPLVSGYSLVRDTISELALGRFGLVQTVAFLVAGIGTVGLAYAIRELTKGTWGSLAGSLLVGVYGLGALLIAFFPTDPVDNPGDMAALSTAGLIHVAASLVSFICMIVGMFVLSRTFLLAPPWRSLFPWTSLFPAAALSLLFAQSQGPWVGLTQRLMVGAIAAWIILVAIRARSIVSAEETRAFGQPTLLTDSEHGTVFRRQARS